MCEKVEIPIPLAEVLTVGNERVSISTLDEVSSRNVIKFSLGSNE